MAQLCLRATFCSLRSSYLFFPSDIGEAPRAAVRKTQPYTKRIAHKGIWVEPELLAEIEYRAKSAEGKVRHPFFKGLREEV